MSEAFSACFNPNEFKAAFSEERFLAAPVMPGPPGKDGAGSKRFHYSQTSTSDTWIINHNLGYRPTSVSVLSPGGVEVEAQVTHITPNQLIISFALPYAGTAEIL